MFLCICQVPGAVVGAGRLLGVNWRVQSMQIREGVGRPAAVRRRERQSAEGLWLHRNNCREKCEYMLGEDMGT